METPQLLIYCKNLSPRVEYVFNHLIGNMLGCKFIFVSEVAFFNKATLPSFAYSADYNGHKQKFIPANLLFENFIEEQHPQVNQWNGTPIFFETAHSMLPFDIFAASFYLLSRYEEYTNPARDTHNRFVAENSLAYQNGFLTQPIIEIWVQRLKEALLAEFPELTFEKRTFKYIPTIDIDNAWAYKHKGLIRTKLGMGRDLIHFNFTNIYQRLRVIFLGANDPFDTYSYMEKLHMRYKLKPIFFFLVGSYGRLDKNVSRKCKKFQHLIKETDTQCEVGIHPSYASNHSPLLIRKETEFLQHILNRNITQSRQHFLMLELPKTYELLEEIGIKHDYTMGYTTQVGFRAGTSLPFGFFNLSENQPMHLIIHPFAVMDRTLKDHLKITPKEAIDQLSNLIQTLKDCNGQFISLWHNESFNEHGEWKGWQVVYEEMLKFATHGNNSTEA